MKELKWFLLTEYDKEEVYLQQKHKEGYKLVKITLPGMYEFEKCTPEEYVYRLDFNPQSKNDKESYIQMFEDYGWEYIQDLNEYSYFRKKADLNNAEENEIFCDAQSRIEMLKRIVNKKMLPVLAVFLCCVYPQLNAIINGTSSPFYSFFLVSYIILFALWIYLMVRVYAGYYRLLKKYEKEIE